MADLVLGTSGRLEPIAEIATAVILDRFARRGAATAPGSPRERDGAASRDRRRRGDRRCRRAVRRLLRERLGPRLLGVVLTGSFARDEGTVLAVDGHLRVLGDIEFLVILPHGRDYRALRPALGDWAREVSHALGERRLRVEIEFGPAEEAYLRRRARPSIFVHDLRTHGRVVWGPSDLLARIPAFAPADIPREDAVHLVFNRAIEQLDAWDRVEGADEEALLGLGYQRLKLRLDLAGSALAFAGRHVSAYAERPAAFAALLARHRCSPGDCRPPSPGTSPTPLAPSSLPASTTCCRPGRRCASGVAARGDVPRRAGPGGRPGLGARPHARRRRAAAGSAGALGRRRPVAPAGAAVGQARAASDAGAVAAERGPGGGPGPALHAARAHLRRRRHRLPDAGRGGTAHRRRRPPAAAGGAAAGSTPPPSGRQSPRSGGGASATTERGRR